MCLYQSKHVQKNINLKIIVKKAVWLFYFTLSHLLCFIFLLVMDFLSLQCFAIHSGMLSVPAPTKPWYLLTWKTKTGRIRKCGTMVIPVQHPSLVRQFLLCWQHLSFSIREVTGMFFFFQQYHMFSIFCLCSLIRVSWTAG